VSSRAVYGVARVMGLRQSFWDGAEVNGLKGATLTAIGAWLVMAWNRFGIQGVTAPRSGTRFVLVGFYAWIGLGLALWLTARLLDRVSASAPAPGWRRFVLATGQAHRPLLLLGSFSRSACCSLPLRASAWWSPSWCSGCGCQRCWWWQPCGPSSNRRAGRRPSPLCPTCCGWPLRAASSRRRSVTFCRAGRRPRCS